jgi:hypothetical protein
MKKLFSFVLALVSLVSVSAKADAKFWVDDTEKIVALVANPTLNIGVVKLEVDDNYYGRLDFSLNYVYSDMNQQAQNILKNYSGYRAQRVVVERLGLYRLQIPILGLSRNVDPKPGADGPYVEDAIYLTKAQYKDVQNELAAGRPLVQIAGTMVGTVPITKPVEHVEIGNSICGSLLGDQATVSSTIARFGQVMTDALSQLDFRYDSTKQALVNDIKANCFQLASAPRVNSFADLLNLPLRVKQIGRPLYGETSKKVYERQEIPLTYEINQNGVR